MTIRLTVIIAVIMFMALGLGSVMRFSNECVNRLNGFVVLSTWLRPVCIKQTAVIDI
jgi:hypothetical protein